VVLALDSLLENAVGFTADGDQIELSVHRHQREVAIIVADSGPGIAEDQLASVFDRFSGTSPQRHDGRHFGLGLSIVHAVAEAHGGRVTTARSPLGGAAVTLWLPLHDPAAGTAPAVMPAPVKAVTRPA
jgi:signal transduction histidine kinase